MKRILIIGLLVFTICLGACTGIPSSDGLSATSTDLDNTIEFADGKFSISMPENWVKDSSYTEEDMFEKYMELCYTDNDITFINVYYYDNNEMEYTIDDGLEYSLEYFGDNVIGEYEEMSLDGMDVYFFEDSMVDLSVDNTEFNYHGYYYIINTKYGVVEIDIYYCQEIFESKIIKPSEEQLLLLQEIAESFEVLD